MFGRRTVGQQHQHVHIRMGKQLAAPIATHRHQRQVRAKASLRPEAAQCVVGQTGQALQRAAHATGRRARHGQWRQRRSLVGLVTLAQAHRLIHGAAFQQRVVVTNGGGVGLPADSVSTS